MQEASAEERNEEELIDEPDEVQLSPALDGVQEMANFLFHHFEKNMCLQCFRGIPPAPAGSSSAERTE